MTEAPDTVQNASPAEPAGRRGKRSSGASGRRAARSGVNLVSLPFVQRKIAPVNLLDEEGVAIIENNADILLEEIGIDFRDDEEALQMWRECWCRCSGRAGTFSKGTLP